MQTTIFFFIRFSINLSGVCEFPPIILHFFLSLQHCVFIFMIFCDLFKVQNILMSLFSVQKYVPNRLLKLFHGTFEIMRNFIEKVSTLTIFHHWYNRFYERFDLTHNQWIVTNFVQHLASFMTWTLTRLCSSNQER